MRSWVQWAIVVLIALLVVVVGLMAMLVFLFHVKGKTAGP
jgi:hypothetical protein